jgi:hypothetical protein
LPAFGSGNKDKTKKQEVDQGKAFVDRFSPFTTIFPNKVLLVRYNENEKVTIKPLEES